MTAAELSHECSRLMQRAAVLRARRKRAERVLDKLVEKRTAQLRAEIEEAKRHRQAELPGIRRAA